MPLFDVLLVGSPEQIPGAFIDLDMKSASGNVLLSGGNVSGVSNSAQPSKIAKAKNDKILSSWWDASAVGTFGYDASYFNSSGTGAVQMTATGQALQIAHAEAPYLPAPQNYTFFSVTSHVTGVNPGFLFTDTGAANLLQFTLDDTGHSHHLTYQHSGGLVDTGVVGSGGSGILNVDCLTLDSAAVVRWFRNSSTPIFTGTNFTGTRFGGLGAAAFVGSNGTAGQWFSGWIGRFTLFNRALTIAEATLLVEVESLRFGNPYLTGQFQHVPAAMSVFSDPPALDGSPSRINPVDGNPERYIVFHRGPYTFIDVVALPVRYGGFQDPVDPSAGFVPHFTEWPFMRTKTEPPTYHASGDPSGVVRLRLYDYGRYCFALYRPGAGAQYVHFNVEP